MRLKTFITLFALFILIGVCIGSVSAQVGGDVAYYSISSVPMGASVTVDGKDEGTTPVIATISASGTPGHTIEVSLAGYETWTKYVPGNPEAGTTTTFNAVLQPGPVTPTVTITIPTVTTPVGGDQGYFDIQSSPNGGEVTFDGQYKGETPVTVPVYTSATPRHTISISYPGYQTWTQTYNQNPQPGQTIYVQANLQPAQTSGAIYVTSSPSGASCTLDGGYTQTTPCTFSGVSAGSHSISIYYSGYQNYYAPVTVYSGQTATVNAFLTPSTTTGNLLVSSSPSGADVYVDGSYYGSTPRTVGNLAYGQHSVTLRLAGYQPYSSTVTINPGQTTSIYPTLNPNQAAQTGDLAVSSSPAGAGIYLDGSYYGRTIPGDTFDINAIVPGSHTVLLSLSGYQDYTNTVTVYAGQVTTVAVTLSRNPQPPTTGALYIDSNPSGAEVYVDNVYRGYSPLTLQDISPGSHVIMLTLGGYSDWQSTVQVTAGETTTVSATFTPPATETPSPSPTTKAGALPLAGLGALGLAAALLLRRKE
jgi:MYXO-CTERM domain-containing protein